jgi:hypothetical protein
LLSPIVSSLIGIGVEATMAPWGDVMMTRS